MVLVDSGKTRGVQHRRRDRPFVGVLQLYIGQARVEPALHTPEKKVINDERCGAVLVYLEM